MRDRVLQLENSILELSSELFRVKHQIREFALMKEEVQKSLRGLKTVLDEKGLISEEDFDSAVELTAITDGMAPSGDPFENEVLLGSKKESAH